MNSVMKGRDQVVDVARIHRLLNQYAELFARMTACWQRVLYMSSPDAKFWHIGDSDKFDAARNQLEDLARTYGIVVVRSSPLLELVSTYRRPDDPWHFAGARQDDYGLASKWQHIVQVAHCLARDLCIQDDLLVSQKAQPGDDVVERRTPFYVYRKPHGADDADIKARSKMSGTPPVFIRMPPH
jgi:hypothetical protein